MASARNASRPDGPTLDDIIVYLMARAANQQFDRGVKVPISDIHDVVAPLEEDIHREFDIPLKFHRSSEDIHSQQVEQALNDIIPYKIPVRNPSFSLNVDERVGDLALESVSAKLNEDDRETLDSLVESDEFRERLAEVGEAL